MRYEMVGTFFQRAGSMDRGSKKIDRITLMRVKKNNTFYIYKTTVVWRLINQSGALAFFDFSRHLFADIE
jgi:hypothetical protein